MQRHGDVEDVQQRPRSQSGRVRLRLVEETSRAGHISGPVSTTLDPVDTWSGSADAWRLLEQRQFASGFGKRQICFCWGSRRMKKASRHAVGHDCLLVCLVACLAACFVHDSDLHLCEGRAGTSDLNEQSAECLATPDLFPMCIISPCSSGPLTGVLRLMPSTINPGGCRRLPISNTDLIFRICPSLPRTP